MHRPDRDADDLPDVVVADFQLNDEQRRLDRHRHRLRPHRLGAFLQTNTEGFEGCGLVEFFIGQTTRPARLLHFKIERSHL